MGRGRQLSKHKNARVKVQNDIRKPTHIFIHKQISPIFNCVTPESVSLASLACQLEVAVKIQYIQILSISKT